MSRDHHPSIMPLSALCRVVTQNLRSGGVMSCQLAVKMSSFYHSNFNKQVRGIKEESEEAAGTFFKGCVIWMEMNSRHYRAKSCHREKYSTVLLVLLQLVPLESSLRGMATISDLGWQKLWIWVVSIVIWLQLSYLDFGQDLPSTNFTRGGQT